MNFNRIGRLLLCFVLICALLINVSPIKAKADAITGAAIVKASTVTCNPYIICAAILIACGLYAGTQTAAFDNLVSNCVDAMAAAGTWIQNGAAELYRVVTDTGEVVYYAAASMFADVTAWAGSNVFTGDVSAIFTSSNLPIYEAIMTAANAAGYLDQSSYCLITFDGKLLKNMSFFRYAPVLEGSRYVSYSPTGAVAYAHWYTNAGSSITYRGLSSPWTGSGTADIICGISGYGISLSDLRYGNIPLADAFVDGTSARAWAEAYANRGLYIASGGNQGDPDDGAEGNDGWKFLLPLTLSSAAILAAMSQTEQWTGSTPPEFDDYTEKEELTVTPAPEVDGLPAIEISPVTNPNPDPNPDPGPGTGSDSDTGGDSAELNWWQRFSQWFLDLRTTINELPNRFDEHFENVNNNIQEVPNKFETWIQNVQTSVDAVAENILGTADEINATINELPNTFFGQLPVLFSAIAAVPEAILAGLRSLFQELFVPSQEYMNNKLQELVQAYPYLQPIISLGDTFKAYLSGVNPTPPVIWIDLGASQWHPLGGRVKFIDLTWYAQYKPTVDGILGAFLWLCLLWRLFQAAPGIVQGSSGFFGNADPHPDGSFSGSNWIAGQRFLTGGFGKRNE